MAKGIIYVMTTVVPGLVKIGKTGTTNFEQRMYGLERNGYFNVTGLSRRFAIEVDDYDEKEQLLDEIFSKSRVPGSELFALDIDLVIQLLSSFEGIQMYPKTETKEESFDKATAEHRAHIESSLVPDGFYFLKRRLKKDGNKVWQAKMIARGGIFTVPTGECISMIEGAGLQDGVRQVRTNYTDENGIVIKDASFNSPSSAGSFVIGASCDGWVTWRNSDGDFIDQYRKRSSQEL
ncbi:MAG: DUF4357 domain-containing protein [Atopobium sp.]|uniref:DUF4357 domain-containing protein n=1 Tax=Atopobium sp. TaxID=1872650 RepID=UPI002A751A17|nr:DUF4357 domain-containing protein [Atopobium sp.]MDY2788018.1 DUF4357 domain-containing protein [Atopobium sp.]